MTRITIVFGVLLILLGLGAYAYALSGEKASVTALIPAFAGVPVLALGLAAARLQKHRALLGHIAVLLAALGLLGAARGLSKLPTLITSPDELERPAAIFVQSVMSLLCLAYIGAAVWSFFAARRSNGADDQ